MITEDKEFIDIENILAKSNLNFNDCTKITEFIIKLSHDNQELKKQLEEKQNPLKGIFAQVNDDTLLRDCGNMNAEINELKNQQKEFIEYLENEINELIKEHGNYVYDNYSEEKGKYDTCIEILQKYKEIIGGKDE